MLTETHFLVRMSAILVCVTIFVALPAVALAAAENEFLCGPLANAYGPFDYRTATPDQRTLVEGAHFTREVETLVRGTTSHQPGGDINYTLRAFPNHPRALKSMMDLEFRKKADRPPGSRWPVWCYFDRAIRFTPEDPQVRMLYGLYLHKKGDVARAIAQLETARELAGDNANLHYNLGLAYFDLRDFDKSLAHAHRAYAMGFPLDGLRNKLKRAGKWAEPGLNSKSISVGNADDALSKTEGVR